MLPYDSRTAVAQDPPSSGRLPVIGEVARNAERPELQRGISPGELRAILGRPETQQRIRTIVAKRLARGASDALVDDIVQQANLAMLSSRVGPRSTESARGWISTIARRAVVDHFRAAASERKWLAPEEPEEPEEAERDEMPAPEEAPDDRLVLSEWLAGAVAGDARDAETFEMLLYKARVRATYDQVAAEHGLTANALRCRVHAFKTKYESRWRRHRAMLVLLLALAVAAVVAAAWVWLRSSREGVRPAAVPVAPTVPATATAAAPDTPFEPAGPPPPTEPPAPRGPARKIPASR